MARPSYATSPGCGEEARAAAFGTRQRCKMRALPGRGLRPLGPRRGWCRKTTWRSGTDGEAPRALLPPGTQTQRRSACRPSTSGSEAAVLAQAQRPLRGAWSCDITEVRSALLLSPLWSCGRAFRFHRLFRCACASGVGEPPRDLGD